MRVYDVASDTSHQLVRPERRMRRVCMGTPVRYELKDRYYALDAHDAGV